MSSPAVSNFLARLSDPSRLSNCENSAISLVQWIEDPYTSCLLKKVQYPTFRNYSVANVGSRNVKSGCRHIDGLKKVYTQALAFNTSEHIVIIQEAKAGTLVPYHIKDTVFLKDYGTSYVNQGNSKARQKINPFIDFYKKIKFQPKRNKIPDKIVYQFISDNISTQAQEETDYINGYEKYITHFASGKQITIKIELTTYAAHIKALNNKYSISWQVASSLTNTLNQFSSYNNKGGKFYNPKIKKYVAVNPKYILSL